MSRTPAAYSDLIHRAMDFAAKIHHGHYRKNREEKVPYISHCAMVGRMLEQAGFDDEVVVAGLLHDAVEDTGLSLETLASRFTERVADLVAHVTEKDKSLPWEERKARYLEGLGRAPMEALAISCADKIHNMWSLILTRRSGGEVWDILKKGRDAQIRQFQALQDLYGKRFDHPLRTVFNRALETLKEEC